MKKLQTFAKCTIIVVLCIVSNLTFAQSSSPNNNWTASKYLGWNSTHDLPFKINGPTLMTLQSAGFLGIGTTTPTFRVDIADNLTNTFLRVRNTGNYAGGIIFEGGGTGAKQVFAHSTGYSNPQGVGKFIIRADSVDFFTIDVRTGSNFGFLGISHVNNFSNPKSLLHLNEGANAAYMQITNYATGVTATDGFKIGISNTGVAELRQQEPSDVQFFTNNTEHLIITDGNTITSGNVGIGSNFYLPQSLLHLHDRFPYIQFTTVYTGSTANDGFLIGSSGNMTNIGYAEIIQKEDLPMTFFTNNLERVRINNDGKVGINTTTPSNILEINSNDPSTAPGGNSGLTFTDLLDGVSPPIDLQTTANPSQGLLSVDATGKVIYVKGVSFGSCTNPLSLSNNGVWNLNNNNFFFEGQGLYNTNSVGIGIDCGNTLVAKLDVRASQPVSSAGNTLGAYFSVAYNSIGNGAAIAVHSESYANGIWGNIGGEFAANGTVTSTNIGISALAEGISNIQNVAVQGLVQGDPGIFMIGGRFNCFGNSQNIFGVESTINNCNASTQIMGGKFFVGSTTSAPARYGVYASVPTTNPSDYAGYFNGNLVTTGTCSDIKVKDSINSYKNALSKIRQLIPSTFYFKNNSFPSINFPQGKRYGMIAQDVEPIFPELVNNIIHPAQFDTLGNMIYDTIHFKNIYYDGFIPIAIEGIKELDSAIMHLQDTISTTAENGLYIDTTAGNPVKLGGNLTEHTKIGLKKNITFASNNNNQGHVCIGTAISQQGEALVVNNKTWITSAKFINTKSDATDNIAASFVASGSKNINYAGQFTGKGDDLQTNYGATFEATGKSKANYAVFAKADGGGANYAGYFNGNLYASSYLNLPSDSKLKDNIQPLTNAMDIINQLQPKTFTFKAASFPSINLPTGQQYGLIAQEVSPILPTLVSTTIHPAVYDSTGAMLYDTVQSKSLNYEAFIPILIQGAKEQQSKIDSMEAIIQDLQNQMSQVLGGNNGGAKLMNTINVELANDAVLYQNIPNPFAEETMINYYIPENTGNAKIIFFDMYGQSMKEVPLTETGSGNIHVDSKNLASGIYSYSLIINGKVIDTKKMVKNK